MRREEAPGGGRDGDGVRHQLRAVLPEGSVMKPWIAKQLYWASLFMDNSDPPSGGYWERLVRRVGEKEAMTVLDHDSGFILAMVLLIGRWTVILGVPAWLFIRNSP